MVELVLLTQYRVLVAARLAQLLLAVMQLAVLLVLLVLVIF
jgi:hypothetical protein